MTHIDGIFDRTGAVSRPSRWQFPRELWALATYWPRPPDPAVLPNGKGLTVLVIPAFLTNDAATWSLRKFLHNCGFRAAGWGLGINWGPTNRILTGLEQRLDELSIAAGGPICIVGISLGGVLARDIAFDYPEKIRHVVTIASPFHLPTASTLEPLFSLCAPFFDSGFQSDRLAKPLPVAATAIFTPDDGLVAWESCREADDRAAVEVSGTHMAICRNPAVLRAVTMTLAGESQ